MFFMGQLFWMTLCILFEISISLEGQVSCTFIRWNFRIHLIGITAMLLSIFNSWYFYHTLLYNHKQTHFDPKWLSFEIHELLLPLSLSNAMTNKSVWSQQIIMWISLPKHLNVFFLTARNHSSIFICVMWQCLVLDLNIVATKSFVLKPT